MMGIVKELRRSQWIAFASVVALHLVLLQIAYRMVLHSKRVDDASNKALVWLRLDPPQRQRPRETAPETSRSSAPIRPSAPIRAEIVDLPPATAAPRRIDWRAHAARSAQLAAEGALEERHRSFGPIKEKPESEEPTPPSIFRDSRKHEYGDVGEVGDKPVVWMSENCYTELDARVQTARDAVIANPGAFAAPAINCVGGERGRIHLVMPNPTSSTPASINFSLGFGGPNETDGTLFEHIKKPEEPPVPKAGTEMNELPERR